MNNLLTINDDQCQKVAGIIKPLKLRKDFYQRPYLQLSLDMESKMRMNFFAVAICHQTHQLYHPGLDIYGWDFIEHVFFDLAKKNDPLLKPQWLKESAVDEIARHLARAFAHSPNIADCSLDRLEERAELMQDAAGVLIDKYDGQISRIFEMAELRLLNHNKGIYEQMPRFETFADPQQKKTTFLLKLLEESNLLAIADPENLIPIMDYHMQRVLLRLGCVEIVDSAYREKIATRQLLDSDEPIRSFCIEAFKRIAQLSGHPVTKMNDFFWSLGRSCCHETMLCHDHVCEKSPCTFTSIVAINDHSRCVFQEVCKGAESSDYRRLWQPVISTHYY